MVTPLDQILQRGGDMEQEKVRSFCRLCQGRCGLLVTVKEGRVVGVEGDRESPISRGEVCPKGAAWPQILYHPDRLRHPQVRKGDRGSGEWATVSWDEALSTIAHRLQSLKSQFGPRSLVIGLGDPKGMELAFAQRFASVFGTPNLATAGSLCHMPRELASTFTIGSPCHPDTQHPPSCILIWGSNIPDTHDGSMRKGVLGSALDKEAKLIVIDPRKTEVASRAHLWLKPRPGSDGALALGMLKVIIEEELYDRGFVSEWTIGFDQLMEHIKGCSLGEVEEKTWVSREEIAAAARLYAQNGPAAIQLGNALDHGINCFQTCRAISILRAITGNIDIPGGDVIPGVLPIVRPGHFMLLRELPREEEGMIGGEYRLAARSAFIPRQSAVRAILEESPYPVKAALLFGTNPLITYPNAQETYRALMKLELLVVAELFMTPTAALADVVLPAAANFEFDEIGPYPSPVLHAYPKVVEPEGDCWSDMRIINELAKRIGLEEHFWADEREALDHILKPSGMTFEEFKRQGMLQAEEEYRKYEKAGFRTPSEKVEIYSQRLGQMGFSPLPVYTEPPESHYGSPGLAKEYPLVLTSGKEAAFCHSAHRNVAHLRRLSPEPVAELHPDTAARFGVGEGEWIYIETRRGRIRQRLRLNADLDPRVVVAAYGWWFPERGASELYGWRESNINVLAESAPPHDPAVGSVDLRGIICRVSKA